MCDFMIRTSGSNQGINPKSKSDIPNGALQPPGRYRRNGVTGTRVQARALIAAVKTSAATSRTTTCITIRRTLESPER